MAFKLEVLRGATAYTISDRNPFSIDEGDLGGAAVRNIDQSGPFQDGSTHLGHRLASNVITLRLFVTATSASVLDGYRDTLNKIFQPVDEVPCILKLTRDDGEIRYLDTWREGFLAIPLDKTTRPGFTHKATVQLRASDPAWYNPDAESASFIPPTGDWWLAYATIGSANVMTHVENPTQGQLWTHTGSVSAGSPYTVAFKSALGTPTASGIKAFSILSSVTDEAAFTAAVSFSGGYLASLGFAMQAGGVVMTAGTHDYFVVNYGTAMEVYRDSTLVDSDAGTSYKLPGTAAGTARWRAEYSNGTTNYWPPALPYAAVYNIAMDSNQRSAWSGATMGTAIGGSAYTVNIAYDGDLPTYPIITLRGPMVSPIITNQTTGDTLDFTGGTVGTADLWIIDTRYGRKSALFGTTSVANYLSTDSDLATFRLVPDPVAVGGTNTVTVSATDAGTAATVTIDYYNRWLSY